MKAKSPSFLIALAGIFGVTMMNTTSAVALGGEASVFNNVTAFAARAAQDLAAATKRGKSLRSLSATPYSLTGIIWNGGSSSCAEAAETVTISCGTGGKISVDNKDVVGKPYTCVSAGQSTVKCTRPASSKETVWVNVKCQNSYRVTATLPKKTYTSCNKSGTENYAVQIVLLGQHCNGGIIYSSSFGLGSLFDSQGNDPSCYSVSKTFKSTSATKCSITAPAVSMTAPKTCLLS